MAAVALTADTFESTIAQEGIVLLPPHRLALKTWGGWSFGPALLCVRVAP